MIIDEIKQLSIFVPPEVEEQGINVFANQIVKVESIRAFQYLSVLGKAISCLYEDVDKKMDAKGVAVIATQAALMNRQSQIEEANDGSLDSFYPGKSYTSRDGTDSIADSYRSELDKLCTRYALEHPGHYRELISRINERLSNSVENTDRLNKEYASGYSLDRILLSLSHSAIGSQAKDIRSMGSGCSGINPELQGNAESNKDCEERPDKPSSTGLVTTPGILE